MLTNLIQERLQEINRHRSLLSASVAILIISISIYFQRVELFKDPVWIITLGLVFAGVLLRYFRFYNIGFFLTGLGHGSHFYDVLSHYGFTSPNASFGMLVLGAFLMGASSGQVAQKSCYFFYVVASFLCSSVSYYLYHDADFAYVFGYLFLFYIYNFSQFTLYHKQLIESIRSQIIAEQEREKLSQIINAVPGFVGFIDRNQICYMANQATLSLYPDIIGRKIGSIDPTSHWEKNVIEFMKTDKLSHVTEEHTVIQGTDIYAILNIQKSVGGGVIIVSIITTELVEAKKKIREQEAKALYSAKLASLGEMAAGIAHEVNNPLTIIQGSAHIIKRLVDTEPLDIQNIKLLSGKLIETTGRITKTIKGLKSLSRNGERDPKVLFPIFRAIEQCIDVSERRLKDNAIELDLPLKDSGVNVKGSEVQIGQVIINLINNSIDAIKGLEEKWIKIEVSHSVDYVELLLTDSGRGIPEEVHQKIMEPFFTTKDVNQGTGLGLSISKAIIDDHGGELIFCPETANTTFKIRLPVASE